MAKARKETLSLEELLEQAIVKEDDRPYEVPENWVWTRIKYISEVVTGTTPSKSNPEYYGEEYPFFKPTDLEQGYNVIEAREYLSELGVGKGRFIPKFSTLVTCIGATIGKCGFSRVDGSANQQINAMIPYQAIYGKYIYWLINSPFMLDSIISNASSTTLPILNKSRFEELNVPVPPVTEQKRIVDAIESLFEKLDTAKELVKNALDSFESRKAAILHKAFTGELTARWREENGVSLDYWEEKPLKDLCNSFQYGTSKKSETTGNVVVLRMGNMQGGKLDWTNLVYTSDEEDIKKYSLKYGDVLFNRTNSPELVGKTSIYRGERPAIFAGYLIRINYKPCLSGEYLNYLLNSPKAKEYCNEVKSDGVNQSNINAQKLGQFKVPYCSLQEQQEIARILDNLLESEQRAKEHSDVVEKIDLMKKAILARAFRGELGTNDSQEESAVELLKGILKEND